METFEGHFGPHSLCCPCAALVRWAILLTYGKILLDSLGNGLLCPENSFCKERLYERVEDFQLLLRSQDHRLLRSPIIGADTFRPSLSHSVKLEDS